MDECSGKRGGNAAVQNGLNKNEQSCPPPQPTQLLFLDQDSMQWDSMLDALIMFLIIVLLYSLCERVYESEYCFRGCTSRFRCMVLLHNDK